MWDDHASEVELLAAAHAAIEVAEGTRLFWSSTDRRTDVPQVPEEVRWRDGGHQLNPSDQIDILRFEVADLNMVIKGCVTASELYTELVVRSGLPEGSQVLPLSCFAVTDEWTPRRLAEDTRYSSYRLVAARSLVDAGFLIWPTEVLLDGIPDPRNEVHYDVIVASGSLDVVEFFSPAKRVRSSARDRVRPDFERLLDLLGAPRRL